MSSGHRAAHAVETDDANGQQRARFLAVRDELSNEWRPNTGLERLLIDTMSQAITMQERRLKRLVLLDTLDGPDGEPTPSQAPRGAIATAIEQAAGMVERFNRLFMRAVRQLRDLRRFAPQVIVQNAAQVNVGNHQLNVDGRVS